MKYIIEILRRESGGEPYRQSFYYETDNSSDTLASALRKINGSKPLTDIDGNEARLIDWECSCLQKKCGACAMVVNGTPTLACAAKLSDSKNGKIFVEPLRKFPVVRDLVVDRSILFENLKTINAWLSADAEIPDKKRALALDASKCLQCGCCLDVCPNFYVGGKFFGMSVGVLMTQLLSELPAEKRKALAKAYKNHVFEGCGKSQACKNICPAGIDTDAMQINSNAMSVWKRR